MNPTTMNLGRIDAWIAHLAEETDVVAHSDDLTRYLTTLSRFWSYSVRNCYLILAQRPTATRVASRKTWESLGRTVKPGEWRQAIQILCPHFKKGHDEITGEETQDLIRFSTGYVYDVAQTDGEPLPEVPWRQTPGFDDLYGWLVAATRRLGLTVAEYDDLEEGVHGWSNGRGVIAVSTRDLTGSRCQTLLHEVAHELCHDRRARLSVSRQMVECQAEAISYCLCQALGIPTPNTPSYLVLYRIDKAILMANLEAIRAGVARVLCEMNRASLHGTAAA